jgi:hypothetical protein
VGIFWGANPVEGGLSAVDEDLILLAGHASLHVLGDPVVHPRPGEASFGLLNRFISPGMACGGVVMDQGHEISLLGLGYSTDDNRSRELLRWEYDHISIVLFALVSSWGSRQDVWSHVGFPRYVVDDEVILLQVRVPSGHSSVEVLQGLPILEIRVIGEDDKGESGPSQVVSPMGQ